LLGPAPSNDVAVAGGVVPPWARGGCATELSVCSVSMGRAMAWTAYVDESEPDPRSGSAGVYLLAAALIEDIEEGAAREVVAGLRLPGRRSCTGTTRTTSAVP